MMILVTGGSGSGKSEYAENRIAELAEDCDRYYIATMQVYDEEGQKRITRHRRMRSGKGFATIEQQTDIEKSIEKMQESSPDRRAALLECMSNLVANEMFADGKITDKKAVVEKIIAGIEKLKESVAHLVIVSNNVFEDGIIYDRTTMDYIEAIGQINGQLARMADEAVEVVVGIPVINSR